MLECAWPPPEEASDWLTTSPPMVAFTPAVDEKFSVFSFAAGKFPAGESVFPGIFRQGRAAVVMAVWMCVGISSVRRVTLSVPDISPTTRVVSPGPVP